MTSTDQQMFVHMVKMKHAAVQAAQKALSAQTGGSQTDSVAQAREGILEMKLAQAQKRASSAQMKAQSSMKARKQGRAVLLRRTSFQVSDPDGKGKGKGKFDAAGEGGALFAQQEVVQLAAPALAPAQQPAEDAGKPAKPAEEVQSD